MPDNASDLSRLPRVDDILAHPRVAALMPPAPHALALEAARDAVEEARNRAMKGDNSVELSLDAVAARAAEILQRKSAPSLRKVINATGIILHTGLGRAPLSEAARDALARIAAGYSNLQIGLEENERIQRESHVQSLMHRITGAEAALVVNNNAAATVLVLSTLAAGREVILSRGELVEIGGAFRIPDIMRTAGCTLVEIGCTNRTHLRDYRNAITPETALILSVHQSNYRIEGFTSLVDVRELAPLAHESGLLCVHDLGSGALVDLTRWGLPHEPTVPESLAAGADVVLFSGDKLVGGPQCGIILGKPEPLNAMRKNPLYRTLRVGKLTLAALESTLRLFLDPETLPECHRVTAMLAAPLDQIRNRAEALAAKLRDTCAQWLTADTGQDESEVGGGSLAGHALPTVVVQIRSGRIGPGDLAKRLRLGNPPVFARVRGDALLIDPRTVLPGEDTEIVAALDPIGQALPDPR